MLLWAALVGGFLLMMVLVIGLVLNAQDEDSKGDKPDRKDGG